MSDLLRRGLPKWPQMFTTGTPMTEEQAKEIIRRTDSFFQSKYGGNDETFDEAVKTALGIPEYDSNSEDYGEFLERERAWDEGWGVLHTSYVGNRWVSCAFVGGPHGWCHPNGDIGYIDNVGKWPDVQDVFDDWKLLAEAFPFIDVGVTLMSSESCEDTASPVVSLVVSNGLVELVDPLRNDVHREHPVPQRSPWGTGSMEDNVFAIVHQSPRQREHGIPPEWIQEWAARARQLELAKG